MNLRRSARAGFIVIVGILFLAGADTSSSQTYTGLQATRVATNLSQPLFATSPPGDYNRLFIVQKTGQIYILKLDGNTIDTAHPFLDISTKVRTNSEQGLLGLAFDPLYASNGKFYLYFVVPGGVWNMGTTHVSQFQVDATHPDVADSASIATIGTVNEKLLVSFDHPLSNHNAGWIAFSPRSNDDHNLYIATGDGGNGYDQDPAPPPTPPGHIEPGGNAQNLTTLLGKMLRIHVNPTTGAASIPSNNPFFGSGTNRQEIFCYGLRNPFRNSFDRATGRMMIADVGQDMREEIDVQDASNPGGGENYEWRLREGFIQTPNVGGARPPGGIEPILDYPHPGAGITGITGNCVIGGYIYRGKQIPSLLGGYIFSDYIAHRILASNYNGVTASNFQEITANLFPTSVGGFGVGGPSSFAEDANGENYIIDLDGGNVFKIVPQTPNVIIDSITRNAQTGHVGVHGYGVPFKSHHVQFTSDLSQAFGSPGVAVTAAGDGSFSYDDASPGSARFYKVTFP